MSCYEAPDGTLYYLHPEFVDVAEDASNPSMLFCDKCNAQVGVGVKKPEAPSHSLAAGVDFGVLSRIPEFCDSDMQLSEAEQMLLSDVRLYHIVTKARRDAAEILPRFRDAIRPSEVLGIWEHGYNQITEMWEPELAAAYAAERVASRRAAEAKGRKRKRPACA